MKNPKAKKVYTTFTGRPSATNRYDCGYNGKAAEYNLKIDALVTTKVSPAKLVDLIKYVDGKRVKFEIKTASGELYSLASDGSIITKSPIFKSDYVIYRATPSYEWYVISVDMFLSLVTNNNLTRLKCSTPMARNKKDGLPYYYDRVTLKTIDDKSSHKQAEKISNLLADYGETLQEFIEHHDIKWA